MRRCGRTFDIPHKVDQTVFETRLQEFHEKYPPSAKSAWKMVANPRAFEGQVEDDVKNMNYKDLSDALYQGDFAIMSNQHSHQIFTVNVRNQRSHFALDMQPHIVRTLVDEQKEAADLLGVFNEMTVPKPVAGRLLEYMTHHLLLRESHWPVQHLQRSQPAKSILPWSRTIPLPL
ncbi:hypothetical protein AX16_008773 [Volvariella volvacea WC 439]|nr:hypothetical protein AX16_008773 [Volvariella volvacea WC 439]